MHPANLNPDNIEKHVIIIIVQSVVKMFVYMIMLSVVFTVASFRISNKAMYTTLIKPKSKQNILPSNIEKSNIRMVVYWSIKSSFDLARYATGAINSFQGTGVWSFIKFDREQKNDDVADEVNQITTIEPKTKSTPKKD